MPRFNKFCRFVDFLAGLMNYGGKRTGMRIFSIDSYPGFIDKIPAIAFY
jgi:hypothetical protein